MINWSEFEEYGTASSDALVDFLEAAITVDELLLYGPKKVQKQIKKTYLWAQGRPHKIGFRTGREYLEDLLARYFRRKGYKIEKIKERPRYIFLGGFKK